MNKIVYSIMMDTNQLEELGKIVGAIITIFGAVKIIPKLTKIGIFFKDYFLAPIRVSKIIAELQPNGGSSLRDSINRIENAQSILSQKLAYSIDQNGCGFFYANALGDCTEVSPGYCRLVGKGETESLGRRWIYNIHPKHRDQVIRDWKLAVENSAVFESNYSMIDSEGNEVPVKCHASPVRNAPDKIVGYFGIIEPENNLTKNDSGV